MTSFSRGKEYDADKICKTTYQARHTIFSTPDQMNHSQTLRGSTSSPLRRRADEDDTAALLSHVLPPSEEYSQIPSHMRPINNTHADYGKVEKRERAQASNASTASRAEHASGMFASESLDSLKDAPEIPATQDAIQQLLDSSVPLHALPDMHGAFPAAESYLAEVSLRLKDRVRQIHVSGSNPREKESKFGGRVLLREPAQRTQKGRAGAPVTERSECSLLWKHSVTLSNKWRRETSLSSEALTLALESLERDVEEGQELRQELRAKEEAMSLLLDRVRNNRSS